MDAMQYQRVAVYGQPGDVGIVGRVSYTDQMHAAFTVPAGGRGVVPASAMSPAKGFKGTPDNAKTKMCMRWMAGDCRFGDRCNFAHGDHELRQLPKRDNVMQPYPPRGYSDPFSVRPTPFRSNSYPTQLVAVGSPQPIPVAGRTPMRAHSVDAAHAPMQAVSHVSGSTTPPYSPTTGSATAMSGVTEMSREAWEASGCPVPGANGWVKYTTSEGEDYFHNFTTNITQWEMPTDFAPPIPSVGYIVPTPYKV
eukprot:TRINITY_DN9148_c0_g1_i2.p3 TRINITY_DN9148_c0_g1~~TRINITY_DN9148_c0_g1_i2.p3  ORF type:complete len:251 (-),score=20.10 TRINITY_DN9148_c0_g1_i2:2374-3126(-)